uniref:Uncharacterized protein n=1 Tax=Steinernema glaseri TaxID=37863 RepID=A0A1I8A2J5_9BILA
MHRLRVELREEGDASAPKRRVTILVAKLISGRRLENVVNTVFVLQPLESVLLLRGLSWRRSERWDNVVQSERHCFSNSCHAEEGDVAPAFVTRWVEQTWRTQGGGLIWKG